jgi:hypothetical protein
MNIPQNAVLALVLTVFAGHLVIIGVIAGMLIMAISLLML